MLRGEDGFELGRLCHAVGGDLVCEDDQSEAVWVSPTDLLAAIQGEVVVRHRVVAAQAEARLIAGAVLAAHRHLDEFVQHFLHIVSRNIADLLRGILLKKDAREEENRAKDEGKWRVYGEAAADACPGGQAAEEADNEEAYRREGTDPSVQKL